MASTPEQSRAAPSGDRVRFNKERTSNAEHPISNLEFQKNTRSLFVSVFDVRCSAFSVRSYCDFASAFASIWSNVGLFCLIHCWIASTSAGSTAVDRDCSGFCLNFQCRPWRYRA